MTVILRNSEVGGSRRGYKRAAGGNPCGDGNVLLLDYVNINNPGVILQHSFVGCFLLRETG